MLQNKFEYLVGFFCCVTDSTGKEYTRRYIDKPADSAQRDARSAYNKCLLRAPELRTLQTPFEVEAVLL